MENHSGSYDQLNSIVNFYSKFLPRNTYPWVMMILSACCVFFSWFGGKYLFPTATLGPRMFYAWLFTAIEYSFLLPGIGGSVEILNMSQNSLAIILHAIQIGIYMLFNQFTTKSPFTWKHAISFPMMIIAVLIIAL
jgi:uncharacterized protein (DUF486 family)